VLTDGSIIRILASRRRFGQNLIVLRGGMGAKQRQAVMDSLAQVPPVEECVLLATGRYIGEGFDNARLDTLFLAMPISWKGTLQQYGADFTGFMPTRKKSLFTTTRMMLFRCLPRCSDSG
jgi:hypothetical protein